MKLRSCLYGIPSPSCKSYADLTWDDRVAIVKLYDRRFNPTGYASDQECQYNQEWWDTLTRDERSAAYWTAMYPERTRKDWVDKDEVFDKVEFYAQTDESNALAWYSACPTHLRKDIEKELEKGTPASSAPPASELYQQVARLWGDRPRERPEHAGEDIETYYWLEEWEREYERLRLIKAVVKHAPRIQEERRMLSQALGLKQGGSGFPNQAEGLDEVTAATVNWITSSGETPLEYLASVYRSDDPSIKISERVNAARALMDFVHRKLPSVQKVDLTQTEKTELDISTLKGLTHTELDTLEKLLKKSLG